MGLILLVLSPLACEKPFSTPNAPLTSPSATPTPTTTLTCVPTPQPYIGAPPNGIYWESADIDGCQCANPSADLLLSVNGAPETTAGVTLTGSNGTTVSLSFNYLVTIGVGYVYAEYDNTVPFVFTAGCTFTLSTTTTIGTASAALEAPGNFTVAPDGSTVGWGVGAEFEPIYIRWPGGNGAYNQPFTCNHPVPPISVPSQDYAYGPGTYVISFCFSNSTTNIINGSGLLRVGAVQNTYVVR